MYINTNIWTSVLYNDGFLIELINRINILYFIPQIMKNVNRHMRVNTK